MPVGIVGVCGWLADGYHYPKTIGGKPKPVAVPRDVTGGWYPPLEECMLQAAGGLHGPGAVSVADHFLGNSVGAIG